MGFRLRALVRVGLLAALAWLAVGLPACDRRIEPFDPDEKVQAPDLSRIFPEGAERAAQDGGDPPMGGRSTLPPGRRPGPAVPTSGGPAAEPVKGTIRIAESLAGRVPEGAVLFLIARGAQPGPPLAAKRIESPRFPLAFEIGPGDRMIQGIPFVGPLTLSARIDADRNAMTRNPGDLQGAAPTPVQPGATGIEIEINEIL